MGKNNILFGYTSGALTTQERLNTSNHTHSERNLFHSSRSISAITVSLCCLQYSIVFSLILEKTREQFFFLQKDHIYLNFNNHDSVYTTFQLVHYELKHIHDSLTQERCRILSYIIYLKPLHKSPFSLRASSMEQKVPFLLFPPSLPTMTSSLSPRSRRSFSLRSMMCVTIAETCPMAKYVSDTLCPRI